MNHLSSPRLNYFWDSLIFLWFSCFREVKAGSTCVKQDVHCSPLTTLSLSYSQTCLVWAHYCKMSHTNFTVVLLLPHVCWDICAHTRTHTIINILNSVKNILLMCVGGRMYMYRDSNGEDWRALWMCISIDCLWKDIQVLIAIVSNKGFWNTDGARLGMRFEFCVLQISFCHIFITLEYFKYLHLVLVKKTKYNILNDFVSY